jgi:group I intron endonuclease
MINIKIGQKLKQQFSITADSLFFCPWGVRPEAHQLGVNPTRGPLKIYNNMLDDKSLIVSEFNKKSGIYLLHNLVNGKQYIGSSIDLKRRLFSYYSPSKLIDGRYISNSIMKYGHNNFTVLILELVEPSNHIKADLLNREQYYIDLLKPVLNLNPTAGSSLGFKHSEETKALLANLRTGKYLSEETKQLLSELFSGELNPFWGKTHNLDTLTRMKLSKIGELNPMYGKNKSFEFIEQMYKDKHGSNNPM